MSKSDITLQHPHHDIRGWGFHRDCAHCMKGHATMPSKNCGIKRCPVHPGPKSREQLNSINYIQSTAWKLDPRKGLAMGCDTCGADRWHDVVEPYPLAEYRDTHTTVECGVCGRQRAVHNDSLVS